MAQDCPQCSARNTMSILRSDTGPTPYPCTRCGWSYKRGGIADAEFTDAEGCPTPDCDGSVSVSYRYEGGVRIRRQAEGCDACTAPLPRDPRRHPPALALAPPHPPSM
jgi:hypothetical protein